MSRRRRRYTQVTPRPMNQPDMRQIVREELAELQKALALPAGASVTSTSAAYLQQLQRLGSPRASGSAALDRNPFNDVAFGPGEPLYPAPINPLLPSGRAAPRRYEYPQSWNLEIATTRFTPWSILRDAADRVSVMRACMEVCKSALTGLDWSFTIDSSRARSLARRAGTSTHAVTSDLQDKFADDMDRLHVWWQKPDRVNNLTFTEWLTTLLEDELALDAIAVYPHLTLGGDLFALEPIDATTIKPLLDDRGAIPQPPWAAYQQILDGFPRGEFSQLARDNADAQFVSAIYGDPVGREARTDALIYKVRNRRTHSPYGFSCVEQALGDVDLWLKRWEWLRSEYTSGVIPEMIVKVDAAMTPEQMREWQSILNDALSGNIAERHRAQFLPQGFDPQFPPGIDSKFSSDLDLHLIRLICAAFDVMPTALGFTPNHGMGGMGGQGHQQGEQDTMLQRATKPRAQWIVDMINEVSRHYLGMPDEVSFMFHGLDKDDEQKESELLTGKLNNGILTLNEARDAENLPRFAIANADEPFIATPTGPAFFNPDVQPVGLPGNLPSAAQNHPNAPELPAGKPAEPGPGTSRDESAQDAKAEQKAFFTFARRRAGGEWRDFTFKCLDSDTGKAANRLAAAGDTDAVKCLFAMHDG